jgi:hypothetical protein
LNDAAAAAFNAWEAKYGKRKLNSAGRTEQQQQAAIDRWNVGGVYNRPPYLYPPAQPARTSPHVRNGGEAVDLADWAEAKKTAGEFGFEWYGSGDEVHFTFRGWKPASTPAFSQDTKNRQLWLNTARGEKLKTDGIAGGLTTAAYKRYQTFLRVWLYGYTGAIDGVWGPGTQKAHQAYWNAYNAKRANTTTGATGQYVKDIQARLNVAGFQTAVDGSFGRVTTTNVKRFQKSRNLVADGIVGLKTRRPLGL